MDIHFIDLSIFVVYLIAMLSVGVYFFKDNKSEEDYFVGGRGMAAGHIGLSVVATDVGGIPELVLDGYNGFLIKPGDIKSLARKIDILIQNKKLREKMGRRAYQEISTGKFSIQRRNKLLREIYK